MFYILETHRHSVRGTHLMELCEVIHEIGHLDVNYWLLQDVYQHKGYDFNLGEVFEKQTENEPKGFCVSPEDFRVYYNSDVFFFDGTFIAINSSAEEEPLLALDSFDATFWYAATTNELIGERLIKCGWEQADMFPRLRGFPDWVNRFKNDKDVIESGVRFLD